MAFDVRNDIKTPYRKASNLWDKVHGPDGMNLPTPDEVEAALGPFRAWFYRRRIEEEYAKVGRDLRRLSLDFVKQVMFGRVGS